MAFRGGQGDVAESEAAAKAAEARCVLTCHGWMDVGWAGGWVGRRGMLVEGRLPAGGCGTQFGWQFEPAAADGG